MRVVIPAERIPEFEKDWASGMTGVAMAAKYGVSQSSISTYARRRCLEPRAIRRDDDYGLRGGQWRPNRRGIQVWVRVA